ncbi:MAG TPA: DNA polymerase III subunit alpha [Fibrobacteria bacterium]|nr:DNA polymerase III subunit alpha [Fibrobacteria bacterium]
MSFVHLHVRSEYSMLEGACRLIDKRKTDKETKAKIGPAKSLPAKAAECGMGAVALTDSGHMFGAVEFQAACKDAKIQPILGAELWMAPQGRKDRTPGGKAFQLVALVEQLEPGYRNLSKLVTVGHTEGYFGRPRIDRELLAAHHEGLIFLSGGPEGEIDHWLRAGEDAKALELARQYKDMLGPDRFFLELQDHGLAEEREVCRKLSEIARAEGLRTVATNSVLCLEKEQHEALEVMGCIRTATKLADADHPRLPSREHHFKTADEMRTIFADYPEACDETLAIAARCQAKIPTGAYFYPSFPLPPGFSDDDEYLAHISREGLRKRWPEPSQEAIDRLEYELLMMKNMKVAGYMLIVADFMQAARNMGIPVGPGRGSAVGSLVAYCTEITSVDPLKYALLFERFLNPERVSMPDIDSDFSDLDRERIIQYVKDKYGKDCVAQIITYGRLKSKAALKDTARTLGIDHNEVNRLTKLFPPPVAGKEPSLDEAIEQSPPLRDAVEADPRFQQAFEIAKQIEGYVRGAGMHAAAVIIAPRNVEHFGPLYCPEGQSDQVVLQYSKDYAENIGLLKMDFLGLRNLSVIQEACRMIERNHGEKVDPEKLQDGDPKTYELLGRGDTIGVFQFESGGMQNYLRQLQPERLEDLIAMNALYRPGPMEQIPVYIRRKQGREEVDNYHPDMEPILGTTYGVMVYQEQVMAIAQKLAGYSLGGADVLRRIMAKKDLEKLQKEEHNWIEGSLKRGYSAELAKKLWDLLIPFAAYAFNKSHAAAYAVVAYQTAWLKANYSAEFLAANCNSELDNTERLVVLVHECKRLGIPVVPPCVQKSEPKYDVQDGKVVCGLAGVKNVGRSVAEAIVADRRENGPFLDLFDLCKRLGPQNVNRRSLESLAMAGAFDELPGTRAQQFHGIPEALAWASRSGDRDQVSLFDMGDSGIETPPPSLPDVDAWPFEEVLDKEREVLGMYLSRHPLDPYLDDLTAFATPLSQIGEMPVDKVVRVGGLVRSRRTRLNKDGREFAFLELEDFSGVCEVAFWPNAWNAEDAEEGEKVRDLAQEGARILLLARVREVRDRSDEASDDTPAAKALEGVRVTPLSKARQKLADTLDLRVDTRSLPDTLVDQLRERLAQSPGRCRTLFHVRTAQGQWHLEARNSRVYPDPELVKDLRDLLGEKNVSFASRQELPKLEPDRKFPPRRQG